MKKITGWSKGECLDEFAKAHKWVYQAHVEGEEYSKWQRGNRDTLPGLPTPKFYAALLMHRLEGEEAVGPSKWGFIVNECCVYTNEELEDKELQEEEA